MYKRNNNTHIRTRARALYEIGILSSFCLRDVRNTTRTIFMVLVGEKLSCYGLLHDNNDNRQVGARTHEHTHTHTHTHAVITSETSQEIF